MSKRITKYDIDLSNRIEAIRDERGLSKDDMAHYKRLYDLWWTLW